MSLPLVLVPGMLCDAELWADVKPRLCANTIDANINAPTVRGMAEQVLANTHGRFVLAGLSLGAIVGFEVLRLAPERVAGFCALSTNPGAPTMLQHQTWREMATRSVRDGFTGVVRDYILPTMFADKEPNGAQTQRFIDMATRIGPTVFRRQLAAQCTRVDALPTLRAVTCPTLVVSAHSDQLCPTSFHREIASATAHARLAHLEGAGHLSTWDRPVEIAELINTWLPATIV